MNKIKAICSVAIVLSATAGAQGPSGNPCADLKKQINESRKEVARQKIDGETDDSVPRASLREQRILVEYQKIYINVSLMDANKCQPIKDAVSYLQYRPFALQCKLDRLTLETKAFGQARQPTEEESNPPSCNTNKWAD